MVSVKEVHEDLNLTDVVAGRLWREIAVQTVLLELVDELRGVVMLCAEWRDLAQQRHLQPVDSRLMRP